MQTKHSIAWGALAIIGFFCLVMLFIAPGAMADSPYNIDGSSGVTTTFTAQAWSNATVTLTQENGVFRYGARFYEEFYKNSDDLLNALMKPER